MERLKERSYRKLFDRDQRSLAHMAKVARNDCVYGGARAMVWAHKLRRMGSRLDYDAVISQAYTSSTGNAPDYLPYECPECGSVHAGQDAALSCCLQQDVYELDDV